VAWGFKELNMMGRQQVLFSRGWACGLLALAVLAATGAAQVQVQLNNPLDANPLQGSGGSNQPIPGYGPVNGNDIVTGNVSGLKYFHAPTTAVITGPGGVPIVVQTDTVGTFSPYTFQGQQGSSDFNDFARQSAGGTQSSIGQTQSYFLPSSTVSTAQGSLYSAPYGSGFDSAIVPRYSMSPVTGGEFRTNGPLSSGIAIREFSATPTNPPATDTSQGMLTSPLFSERQNASQPLNANAPIQGTTPDTGLIPATPDTTLTPDGANGQNPDDTDNSGKMKPTGRSANERVSGRNSVSETARVSGRANEVKNANVLPEDQTLAQESRVSDTYRTLLQRVKSVEEAAAAKEKAENAENPNGVKGQNGKGNTPSEPVAPGTLRNARNTVSSEQPDLDPLTGLPRKVAPGMPGVEPGTQSTDPSKPGYRPRSAIMNRSRLESTPTSTLQAGKDVEPLKTLADVPQHATPTAFSTLMAQAEALLKQGKYLEAADAYQTAITTDPDDALAVIGRANAELGAGMYESAANDLRFVFTRKPELTGVRYSLGDFIAPERQNYLIKDLEKLSKYQAPGNTASFLLCYMYYNTGRVQDMQAELARWSNRPWHDEWEGVLARAWGEAK
jgi:tetratricopeptide (TPR) repeat protein